MFVLRMRGRSNSTNRWPISRSGCSRWAERSIARSNDAKARTIPFTAEWCQYRPPMYREDCSEPRTSELINDGADAGFVGRLTDQPTEIRRMKLPIGARCGADMIVKLLRLRVSRVLRHRSC